MRGRFLAIVALFALVLAISGCRKPVELQGIERIAVLTLDNYTSCQALGTEIKLELLRQIPGRLMVEVIDGAPIEADLPANAVEAALGDPAFAAGLGRRYGVDALLVGAATTYREWHDGNLGVQWVLGESLTADVRVEIGVTVAFNLRLLRLSDGTSLFYRQSAKSSSEELVFGLGRPYVSFTVSAEPHFHELREAAVHDAVRRLVGEVVKEARKRV